MENINKISKSSTFPVNTENLEKIREFITSILDIIQVYGDLRYNIILAVDEACTNVIKHAYSKNSDEQLKIELEYENPNLKISIIDNGKGFNPDQLPSPDIKEYYQKHKIGGWGLYLMKSLMDKVDFYFDPGNKNIVSLTKKVK